MFERIQEGANIMQIYFLQFQTNSFTLQKINSFYTNIVEISNKKGSPTAIAIGDPTKNVFR